MMATLDKADFGIITMRVTKADLDKIKPILDNRFGCTPTHCHHIIKNRGGKWVGVTIWLEMDLDTINVYDTNGFVTTFEYQYVKSIAPTELV